MSYTRRDYETLAAMIARQVEQSESYPAASRSGAKIALQSLAHGLALYFAASNSRFEIERFLTDAKCPPIPTIETQE